LEERKKYEDLLRKYIHLFAFNYKDLREVTMEQHKIELLPNAKPIRAKQGRWNPKYTTMVVATLFWPSVGVKPNTWKSWELESSGTPECLELDSRTQNTSHWGVLGVIGKFLKRRYRK